MLAFDVCVNGKRLCLAGTAPNDMFSTIISWTCRSPNLIEFNVGGIASGDPQVQIDWTTPRISIGDEITIRLVDSDTFDESGERRPMHLRGPESRPESQHNVYMAL